MGSESAFTIRLKGDPGSRDSWAVVQLPSTVAIKEFLELQVWARSNLDDPDSRGQQLILATYKRKAKAAPATEEESWSMNSAANAASSLVRNTSVMDLGKNLKHSAMGIGMEEDHGMSDRILRDAQHKAAVAAKNEERLSSPQGSPESVSASDMATALESLLHCIKDEGMDPQKTMAKFEDVCKSYDRRWYRSLPARLQPGVPQFQGGFKTDTSSPTKSRPTKASTSSGLLESWKQETPDAKLADWP